MGLMKQLELEFHDRGYGENKKEVCRDCVRNKDLQLYIKDNGYMSTCCYCNKKRKVVTIESLLEPIMSGIYFEYEHAEDSLGVCDGEYVGTTYSSYDLIHEELVDELNIDNYNLLNDISNTMIDFCWCKINPYMDKQYDTEFYTWQSFCNLVIKKVRYVFYKSNNTTENFNALNPVDILETISKYVEDLDLIKYYKPENRYFGHIYRGRMHNKNEELTFVESFGPPPHEKASANRMSAQGIPMFYGAFDEETVLSEIYDEHYELATIASFNLKKPLLLLNLARIKEMKLPSIFNEINRGKRSALQFLKLFADNISNPVDTDHIVDYTPTQIVTEYFRHVFKTSHGEKLDGIIYNSTKNQGHKCVALFMTKESFLNEPEAMLDLSTMKIKKYQKKLTSV